MPIDYRVNLHISFLLLLSCLAAGNASATDSSQIKPPGTTSKAPYLQKLYNQTLPTSAIITTKSLQPLSCLGNDTAVASAVGPQLQYAGTIVYYTHFHYECGNVAGPASCTSTNGHDYNAPSLTGDTYDPNTIQWPNINNLYETPQDYCNSDCTHDCCSYTSGTYTVWSYYKPSWEQTITSLTCAKMGWTPNLY